MQARPLSAQSEYGVVTSGHYLATDVGLGIMRKGGNAIDAAAAMCFALNLLEPHQNSIGTQVPIMVYSAKDKAVYAISGVGTSPKSLTIDWFREHSIDMIPGNGYLPATVPAVVDAWATALMKDGTMNFSEILEPTIKLAEEGFPMYEYLHNILSSQELYPTTHDLYCPNGQLPKVGEIFHNPDLANTLKTMCSAEKQAEHKGRIAGIQTARDSFYKGDIARRIIDFIQEPVKDAAGTHSGFLSLEDMAEYHGRVEEPVTFKYGGLEVHKCSSWTQGPVFLQQLAILEGLDFRNLGHNSTDYLHKLIEAAKLAFADRESYYGDPIFDKVPIQALISKEYAATRRSMIDDNRASMEMRPGEIAGYPKPTYAAKSIRDDNRTALGIEGKFVDSNTRKGDTTCFCAVDKEGNMVIAVPSISGYFSSPIIKGLGFSLDTRGQSFYLNPDRPNALVPGKRPRATLTPTLVTKNDRPYMVLGTRGGDRQDQWTLQLFLNLVEHGMDIEQALNAPKFYTDHFPSSFYPRESHPGHVFLEQGVPSDAITELEKRGHKIVQVEKHESKLMCILYDDDGIIRGGVEDSTDKIGSAMGL